ncbi:hypothetical protein EWM64_g5978 [Hericium alpestre]|uniref:Uncharacterized protein n=1 Tax=Hericium alpestre TaxID=135208 RepID=A0A4Y9ZTX8_9AGAM|nr:hypothetical protein EWM64_g5978 [Hericium alpestre]
MAASWAGVALVFVAALAVKSCSTKPPEASSDPLTHGLSGHPGREQVLSTVVEEDPAAVDDWEDDFEPINLADIRFDDDEDKSSSSLTLQARSVQPSPAFRPIDNPPAPPAPEPLTHTSSSQPSYHSDPFATPSDYRSPVDSVNPPSFLSRSSSFVRAPFDKTPAANSRTRTSSKASKRSHRSEKHDSVIQELKLLLDFPLPPSHIPTPVSGTPVKSIDQTASASEVTPVADDSSIFYDQDPFRAESILEAEESSAQNRTEYTPAASSASFHTAQSRASSPSRRSTSSQSPAPTLHQSRDRTPSPTVLPSHDSTPLRKQASIHTTSASIYAPSISTKASSTLKRFGSLTKETLRASFRTPISQLSSSRSRRKQRGQHVPADNTPEPSVQQEPEVAFNLLPEFKPEALDITFPAFDATSPRVSRAFHPYPQRSVQSFYGSLEDFLSGHTKTGEPTRHHRFRSVPSLLPSAALTKPEPAADTQARTPPPPEPSIIVTPPVPHAHPPRPTRPLPPLPVASLPPISRPVKFELVDPLDLTSSPISPTYSNEFRYSSISLAPGSPSWLSRNVEEIERALFAPPPGTPSPSSVFVEVTDADALSDAPPDFVSDDSSTLPYPTSTEAETPPSPSPLPVPSALPLPHPTEERQRPSLFPVSPTQATISPAPSGSSQLLTPLDLATPASLALETPPLHAQSSASVFILKDHNANMSHPQSPDPSFDPNFNIFGKGTDTVDFGGEPDYANYEWFKEPPPPQDPLVVGETYTPPPGVIEQNEMFEFALKAAPNVLYSRYRQYGQLGVSRGAPNSAR